MIYRHEAVRRDELMTVSSFMEPFIVGGTGFNYD